jgi:cyclophilin family peptidyl-prolyl cis-trans isomerase
MFTRVLMVFGAVMTVGCAADREPARPDITSMSVHIQMHTSAGDITLELDPVLAPISTSNFLDHMRKGHYDGTVFHRVVPEFVIQAGGWTADLKERAKIDAAAGRPDATIKNEWENGLKNERGTIGMAREEAPDTATREFYINLKDNFKLDTARPTTGNAGYAVFGHVVSGWEVVEAIAAGKTSPRQVEGVTDGSMDNVPDNPVIIMRMKQVASPVPQKPKARELAPHER